MDSERVAHLVGVSQHDVNLILDLWAATQGKPRLEDERACLGLVRFAVAYRDLITASSRDNCQRIDGPGDWRVYSRQVLDAHHETRHRILGLFGREAPFPTWNEALSFLERTMKAAPQEGRWRQLDLRDANGMVVTFAVYDGLSDRDADEDVPRPPLFELAGESLSLARSLRVAQHQIIAWLMADEPFTLPWITGHLAENRSTGTTTATLHIMSTEAHPEEVASAYDQLRHLDMRPIQPGPLSRPYKRSRTTDRLGAMVAFVDAYKASSGAKRVESWPALAEAFSEQHPEYKPFKPESMRVQYSQKKQSRAKSKKGGE